MADQQQKELDMGRRGISRRLGRKLHDIVMNEVFFRSLEEASEDNSILARLKENPKAYLQARGISVPDGASVNFSDGPPWTVTLSLSWEGGVTCSVEVRREQKQAKPDPQGMARGRELDHKVRAMVESEQFFDTLEEALEDEEVCNRLKANPKAHFRSKGIRVPPGADVHVTAGTRMCTSVPHRVCFLWWCWTIWETVCWYEYNSGEAKTLIAAAVKAFETPDFSNESLDVEGIFYADNIVAFRGSEPPEMGPEEHWWIDWFVDCGAILIDAWPIGGISGEKVHAGWLTAYRSVRGEILKKFDANTPSKIFVTGHSAGGALAILAAFDLRMRYKVPVTMYNFGSPRVGDLKFMLLYNLLVPDSFRVVIAGDVVPLLPWWFLDWWHVGQEKPLEMGETWNIHPGPGVYQQRV